jgi:hypothetical protein
MLILEHTFLITVFSPPLKLKQAVVVLCSNDGAYMLLNKNNQNAVIRVKPFSNNINMQAELMSIELYLCPEPD